MTHSSPLENGVCQSMYSKPTLNDCPTIKLIRISNALSFLSHRLCFCAHVLNQLVRVCCIFLFVQLDLELSDHFIAKSFWVFKLGSCCCDDVPFLLPAPILLLDVHEHTFVLSMSICRLELVVVFFLARFNHMLLRPIGNSIVWDSFDSWTQIDGLIVEYCHW
jgi:hypothetical protein